MDPGTQSFWDRRPWAGAAIFGSVVVAVGTFLAISVGARPHFRRFEAPLLVTLPDVATVAPDAPWASDPVGIHVRVRVADTADQPVSHVQVVLVDGTDDQVICSGFTTPPEGHLHLPIPVRFDRRLSDLRICAVIAGQPRQLHPVPVPHRGLSTLTVTVGDVREIRVLVENEAGTPIGNGTVQLAPDTGTDPWLRPWPLKGGVADLGGVDSSAAGMIVAQIYGCEPTTAAFSPATQRLTLPPGARATSLSFQTGRTEGAPHLDRVRARILPEGRSLDAPTLLLTPDSSGTFSLSVPPETPFRLVVSDRTGGAGSVIEVPALSMGERRALDPVAVRPFPVLVEGTVAGPGGALEAGALVTLAVPDCPGRRESAITDRQGVFRVRGPLLANRAHLSVSSGKLGLAQEVTLPARDQNWTLVPTVDLRLQIAGALEGSAVALTLPGGARSDAPFAARTGSSGGVAFPNVPPGAWELIVGPDDRRHSLEVPPSPTDTPVALTIPEPNGR